MGKSASDRFVTKEGLNVLPSARPGKIGARKMKRRADVKTARDLDVVSWLQRLSIAVTLTEILWPKKCYSTLFQLRQQPRVSCRFLESKIELEPTVMQFPRISEWLQERRKYRKMSPVVIHKQKTQMFFWRPVFMLNTVQSRNIKPGYVEQLGYVTSR